MRVCFSVGPMSSKIINSISKSADNVEFSSYSTISDMIKESNSRHIFFDRIVFSEKILKNAKDELHLLNNYISENSDNTKIVFICQGNDNENSNLFSELFTSPLHTVVLVEKVTTSTLLEFVKGDIQELKAKYYSLDVKTTKSVTSKYTDTNETVTPVGVEKVEKKGFLKSLFGGKKNVTPKVENKNPVEDTSLTEGNMVNLPSQNTLENPIPSSVGVGTSIGVLGAGLEALKSETNSFGNSFDSVPGLGGGQDFNNEFSSYSEEEDILGIGDLGEQHVDTGFLDEDAENEIEEMLRESESIEEDIVDVYDEGDFSTNSYVEEEVIPVVEPLLHDKGDKAKFRLVIGERGVGATSYIVDHSVASTERGKRVLIVDLDYINNGILSYIEADNYYNSDCDRGIDRLKVYSEDGVDVISNGYGYGVSVESLVGLLKSELISKYDIIFIDCPIDCISCLDRSIISDSVVMIKVGGNKGSLLSVLGKLTSRNYIGAKEEDILFANSKFDIVNKVEYYKEDLEYIRNTCYFGREDWCSKIV